MSTETVLKCDYVDPDTDEVCGTVLEYGGRGRPPTKCAEHKRVPAAKKEETQKGEEKVAQRQRPGSKKPEGDNPPAARQRPGSKPAEKSEEKDEKSETTLPPPSGTPDTKSRAKAEAAHKRTETQVEHADSNGWPVGSNGRPMARIMMTASELIPTGQYANVSVGPAQITLFVDLDRASNGGGFFTESEKTMMAKALNELAEVVEGDVVAVQRAIVLNTLQGQQNA